MLFGSPLYIPESGGQLETNGGEIASPDPFIIPPPSQLDVFGAGVPVSYQIDQGAIRDIVLHASAGTMVRVGGASGPWAKLSYVYEPIPRVLVGYEGYLDVVSQSVEVTLHPRVVYHHLAALESGYEGRGWRVWGSLLGERPVADDAPDAWTLEETAPATLAAATLELEGPGLSRGLGPSRWSLGYIQSWGGFAPDQGVLAAPGTSIFESRYPYRKAALVQTSLPLSSSQLSRWSANLRAIYEFTVTGALISLDLYYQYGRHWQLDLGGDAIGAAQASASDGGADFFDLYRSDSRVRAKASYVF
jgi:hypothetical protein